MKVKDLYLDSNTFQYIATLSHYGDVVDLGQKMAHSREN